MSDSSVHTTQLHQWLERMRSGDLTARDDLLRALGERLEHLARKMLQRFANVRPWADTGDILHNALLRLLHSLEKIQPSSMRDFFGLAAEHMRRELLDVARRFRAAADAATARQPPSAADPEELERWCAFHEGVANLPAEDREVIGLIFYHGWTQLEVADLFQVSERTVRRRWHTALAKLQRTLKDVE